MKLKRIIRNIAGVALIALVFSISSCKRDTNSVEPIQKATNIKELSASPTFDWSTHKEVTFNVTGLPVGFEVKRKLIVKNSDGTLYFNIFHDMNKDLVTKFTLPAHVEEVTVEFGTITKEVKVTTNTINFTFAQDIPNELD